MSVTRKYTICEHCNYEIFLRIPEELKSELYYYLDNDLLNENGHALTDLPCPNCYVESSYTVLELLYLLGEIDIKGNQVNKKEKFVKEY